MGNSFESDIPNMESKLINLEELLRTRIGYSIEGEAKQTAPVDTGVYRNNITFNGKNQIIAHASYSKAIEYGIAPSDKVITPKSAKVLHFKKDGKDVFVKWAKPFQRGRKPKSIMRNAARTVMKRDFNRIFQECWKGIMK